MPITNSLPSASSGNMENNCALCATVMDNTNPCYYLACKHVFHKNCVEAWLTENCSASITRKEIKVGVGICSPSRSQQVPPPPDSVSRGVPTRNLARTLAQLEEANTTTIPDRVPLNASGTFFLLWMLARAQFRWKVLLVYQFAVGPAPVDQLAPQIPVEIRRWNYNTIHEIIEQTVNTVISSLSIHNRP